ncbi:keratin-associated protein 19-9b-like [Tribolium madens]|uniref:keratin-associated protein 19-9b-like n=1 Tax=Tribolium madens TaxID=41895 RepID=UPI001CF73253|nr:keratin-associated protein 19-9b-like [Tribolium madens]
MFKLFVFLAFVAFAFAAPKAEPQYFGGYYGGLGYHHGLGYAGYGGALGYGYASPYSYGHYGYGYY